MKPNENQQNIHGAPFNNKNNQFANPSMAPTMAPRTVWPQQPAQQRVPVQFAPNQIFVVQMPQGMAIPPGCMFPGQQIIYPPPMPPPHVASQMYTQKSYPSLQKVEAVPSKKHNRAVPIVDPSTRQIINDNLRTPISRSNQNILNTDVPEFVPGSKRNDQRTSEPGTSQTSQERPKPIEFKVLPPQHENIKILRREQPVQHHQNAQAPQHHQNAQAPQQHQNAQAPQHHQNAQAPQHRVDSFSQRDGYSSREGTSPPGRRDYQSNRGRFNYNNSRGGGRNYKNMNYSHPQHQKADKQVSTHNQNYQQHQAVDHHHGKRESFYMPSKVPPFQRNTNNQYNKQNKQTTARPSTSMQQPIPEDKDIPEENSNNQIVKPLSKTDALDAKNEIDASNDTQSSISTKSIDVTIVEQTVDQEINIAESDEVSVESEDIIVETTQIVAEIVDEPAKPAEKVFYRYTIPQLHKIKEGNPLVASKPLELGHPLFDKMLNPEIRQILFDKDYVLNEKGEYTVRKHNSSFGKSGQLSKRNSAELRRSESFSNNRSKKGGHSPNTSCSNIDDGGMIRINLNENVKLNEAEDAWRPTVMKAREEVPDTKRDITKLSKSFRSLLNKMTEENFDILLPEVERQEINTNEKLDNVVNIVFEKSVSEPGFASMYAKLCKILASVCAAIGVVKEEKVKTRNALKKSLITRCQSEFENAPENNSLTEAIVGKISELKGFLTSAREIEEQLKGSPEELDSIVTEKIKPIDDQVVLCNELLDVIAVKFGKKRVSLINENEDKDVVKDWVKKLISTIEKEIDEFDCFQGFLRRRANGTIKFIGELYKVDLLTPKIMFGCIRSLLNPDAERKTSDDNLERLSKLLTTIGKELDKTESNALGDIFKRLQMIVDKNQVDETRVRFEVMNVIELRKRRWVPRENQRSNEINPMKLDDFAEEVRKKELQQQFQNNEYDRNHQHDRQNQQNYNHRRNNSQQHHHHSQQQQQQHGSSRGGNQKFQRDSDGFISNQRNTIDMSRINLNRGASESNIRLGPQTLLSGFLKQQTASQQQQQQQQQKQQLQPTFSNPFSQLNEDSDGSEALAYGSRLSANKNNSRGGRNKQQTQETTSVTILKRNQTLPCLPAKPAGEMNETRETEKLTVPKLKTMPKLEFEKLMKTLLDGKLLMENFLIKMKGYCVDAESLALVICYYHDRSSSERLYIAKAIVSMYEQDKESIPKKVVIAALDECYEFAEDFMCDVPKIYEILEQHYYELRKIGFLEKEDIEAACNDEMRSKFAVLFNPDKSYKQSSLLADATKSEIEEELVLDETIIVNDSSTPASSPSTVTESQADSLLSMPVQSNVIARDHFMQPPADVIVGKFDNIRKKFEYALGKNMKKPNLDYLIKIIENENCKYENTFIAELTKEIIKANCQKAKSTDYKHIESLLGNTLDLIKRYINNNLTLELHCISTLQAHVYGVKNEFTELLRTFFEIFYEHEVISYEAFKIWYTGLSEKAKTDKAVQSTSVFFKKLEAGDSHHEITDFNCTSSTIKK